MDLKIAPNGNKVLDEQAKNFMINEIEKCYNRILEVLQFDRENHNIKETPKRIAKMYVNELFKGCYSLEPEITTFPNLEKANQMVVVGPLDLKSTCAHHFVPFIGEAYVGYIPNEKLVGLSKFPRVVNWFMRRPQIQEELITQIADYLEKKLEPQGLGVYITAKHLCMTIRGVEQTDSYTDNCALRGIFKDEKVKAEFMNWINLKKK